VIETGGVDLKQRRLEKQVSDYINLLAKAEVVKLD
jgi:hypothetical protein